MRAAALVLLLAVGCRRPSPSVVYARPPVTHTIQDHGISFQLPATWEDLPPVEKSLFQFGKHGLLSGYLLAIPTDTHAEATAEVLVEKLLVDGKIVGRELWLDGGVRLDVRMRSAEGLDQGGVIACVPHRGRAYIVVINATAASWPEYAGEVADLLRSFTLFGAPTPAVEAVVVQGPGFAFELPARWSFLAFDAPEHGGIVAAAWDVGGFPSAEIRAAKPGKLLRADAFMESRAGQLLERGEDEAIMERVLGSHRVRSFIRWTSTHVIVLSARADDFARYKDVFERAARSLR